MSGHGQRPTSTVFVDPPKALSPSVGADVNVELLSILCRQGSVGALGCGQSAVPGTGLEDPVGALRPKGIAHIGCRPARLLVALVDAQDCVRVIVLYAGGDGKGFV